MHMQMMGGNDGASQLFTSELFSNDVLLGRGTGPNEHIGNCIFREEVELKREPYVSASSKAGEEQIISSIISSIHQRGGRFLRKLDAQSDPAGKTLYEVILDKKVLAYKIKQAIRYSKRREKKSEASSEPTTPLDKLSGAQNRKTVESSQASPATMLSPVGAKMTNIANPLSRPVAARDPLNALTEAERIILMSQQSPYGLSNTVHSTELLALSQFHHPPTTASNTFLRDQVSRNAGMNSNVLDHLALLHLRKVDPRAAQLVLEQRLRQQQLQQQQQLAISGLPRQFGFSATDEQQLRQTLEGRLEPILSSQDNSPTLSPLPESSSPRRKKKASSVNMKNNNLASPKRQKTHD